MRARFLVLCLGVAACGDPDVTPPDTVSINGAFEKGPFVLGSSIDVSPLNDALDPTGQVFSTETVDDAGRFTIEVEVGEAGPLALEGSGFYYNEVTGALSTAPITLRALDDAGTSGAHDAYVNVITHLAYARAQALAQDGMTVGDAEAAAEAELVAELGIGGAGFSPGAPALTMTILGGDTDRNAYLFAVSAVLAQAAAERGGPIDAALQELINTLAVDLADDGALVAAASDELRAAQQALDTALVMDQLEARLDAIGSSAEVPDLDRVIDTDLDGVLNAADNCRRYANEDQADTDDDGIGDVCEFQLPDVGGEFLYAIHVPIGEDGTVFHLRADATLVEVTPTTGTYGLTGRFLDYQTMAPAGDELVIAGVAVAADATFAADADGVIPAEANPISGTAVTLDAVLAGTLVNADFQCGTVTGTAGALPLDGATWAAVRITGKTLPTPVTSCPD